MLDVASDLFTAEGTEVTFDDWLATDAGKGSDLEWLDIN